MCKTDQFEKIGCRGLEEKVKEGTQTREKLVRKMIDEGDRWMIHR